MSDNPYAPPQSSLLDEASSKSSFFTVAPLKLTVMLLFSAGFYYMYWNYKKWAMYKVSTGRSIWPIARTIFSVVYLPVLYYKVDQALKWQGKQGIRHWVSSMTVYYILVLWMMLNQFLIEFVAGLESVQVLDGIVALIVMFMIPSVLFTITNFIVVVRLQRFINLLNGDPKGAGNAGLTMANGLWIAIGSTVWIIPILSAYAMLELLQGI